MARRAPLLPVPVAFLRGLPRRPLLIRRSLVRAQVGQPRMTGVTCHGNKTVRYILCECANASRMTKTGLRAGHQQGIPAAGAGADPGAFRFEIACFHSDNGSDFINGRVVKLLQKLLVEQTKSRARHSNDNALAESKNASVVCKHKGYSHIPQKYAKPINEFYQALFNPWLNLHRPCMFASNTVNAKGKPCPTWCEPERGVGFQRGTSLRARQRG